MDNRNQNINAEQLRAERRKRAATQRYIRIAAIALSIILSIAALLSSCSTKKAINDLAAQLQAKKAAQAQQALLEEQAATASDPDPEKSIQGKRITMSFIGDITLCSEATATSTGSFEEVYVNNDPTYFFENVRSILEGDDLTVANLECSLTNSDTSAYVQSHYRADPSYVSILNNSGIEAFCTANDHTQDYSSAGYVDTLATLDVAGLSRFGADFVTTLQVNGVTVGLTAVDCTAEGTDYQTQLLSNLAKLEEKEVQISICYLNWGSTEDTAPDSDIIQLAHDAIDGGADLVLGVNPRALQGIERYKDRYICYSLGRFCNGKESQLEYSDTMIFRQTFELEDGVLTGTSDYQILPCSMTSSGSDVNNYKPKVVEGDEAERIIGYIYDCSMNISGGINRTTASQGNTVTPAATQEDPTAATETPDDADTQADDAEPQADDADAQADEA